MSDSLHWQDLASWPMEGRGWSDTPTAFCRLPARAESIATDAVWTWSQHSAGVCVRFQTDAPRIDARWEVRDPGIAWTWMPPVGANGLDLYTRGHDGRWYWAGFGNPTGERKHDDPLTAEFDVKMREYLLYLPVANQTLNLSLGVEAGYELTALPPRGDRAIAYYGTSIVHGCACTRPGMAHAAILSRRLDHNILNLGFAGAAIMEAELAELFTELDPAIWILDPLPNMTPDQVAERAATFIRILHEARPTTPIVLIKDRTMPMSRFRPVQRQFHDRRRANYRAAYEQIVSQGADNLYYVEGESLLGDDGEGTIDNSHPTDLGFQRYADALEPALRQALAGR